MNVYSLGRAAALCRASNRTMQKWFDKHYVTDHRLPDSTDRRIHGDSLRAFMEERGIPTDLLDLVEGDIPGPVLAGTMKTQGVIRTRASGVG